MYSKLITTRGDHSRTFVLGKPTPDKVMYVVTEEGVVTAEEVTVHGRGTVSSITDHPRGFEVRLEPFGVLVFDARFVLVT